MKLVRLTLLGLAVAAAPVCFAQWQWIDNNGRRVFSDQAPPPDVPANRILRSPAGRVAPQPDDATDAAPAPEAAAPAPKISGKDKELEAKRKQAQAEAAEKKKAQEEENARRRAENCERAKQGKATLDSGIRLSTVNAKGEREIMDDAARAAEGKRLDAIIAQECQPAS